mgnify:CR=1 FL=1
MTSQVAIIGDGQMGLVLADALFSKGMNVTIWSPFEDSAVSLKETKQSPRLPSFTLPAEVDVTSDSRSALSGADIAINAIPTQFIRKVWSKLKGDVPREIPIGCVAKGVEIDTLLLPTQVLQEVLEVLHPICVLSGPTIATELAEKQPAVLVASSTDISTAAIFQDLFDVSWLRLYTHNDPLGVEIAGALKNVIAIAAGICDGMQLGDNAKSAMLSRGLAEISRLGVSMGAQLETFFGIAGVGDLATTCFSPHGRNRTCGERLGKGESLESIESTMGSVVEGVPTTKAVRMLANNHKVEMPISEAMYQVLYESLNLQDAINLLMNRDQKEEYLKS